MHFSKDTNNFRNEQYIENMEQEFLHMFRAYHKYISYRNKLLKELTISEEQQKKIIEIDQRFIYEIKRANKRINKDDFNNYPPV